MNPVRPYLIILGAGESGIWSAILACEKGYRVLLSDRSSISDEYKSLCRQHGIRWEEGGHHLEGLSDAEAVVKSPGIPDTAEVVIRCQQAGLPILSEIEFAARYAHGSKLIAITGSNGKTTTTSLLTHLLREGGLDATSGGNIGTSLAQLLVRSPHEIYVLELSSFQLDHMYDFKADIALLTNITPDHLDRYDHSLERYADSKGRIFANQTSEDLALYCSTDRETLRLFERQGPPSATLLSFALCANDDPSCRAFCRGNSLTWQWQGKVYAIPYKDLPLQGPHNRLNMLAAGLVALACGIGFDDIRRALGSFRPIEHRLEPCGVAGGVRYINDSKATNIDSTRHALAAMPEGRTVLILGGTDKGNDYTEILAEVTRVAKALIFLTTDSAKLHRTFDPLGLPTYDARSMDEVFEILSRFPLEEGDIVLLSPACASFDLFHNYEHRGTLFKQAVRSLCTP